MAHAQKNPLWILPQSIVCFTESPFHDLSLVQLQNYNVKFHMKHTLLAAAIALGYYYFQSFMTFPYVSLDSLLTSIPASASSTFLICLTTSRQQMKNPSTILQNILLTRDVFVF